MNKTTLEKTVAHLTDPPRGILAADESVPTCNKRFEALGIPTTEENRRKYRELLITAPDLENYISGVIFFDETIRQKTTGGESFISVLESKSIEVGIKVDQGLEDLPEHPGEKITKGLEGLAERIKEYKTMNATFAKWRSVYSVGENTPSEECMQENASILARYSLLCQEKEIVPIIEPEVLLDGEHSIEECYEATARNLDTIFSVFKKSEIFIPGVILKTSMVMSGKDAREKAPKDKIAELTLKCLKEHVPKDIGAVVFLSGGQSEEEATEHLDLMHKTGPLPWNLTFSYSRALQNSVLKYWAQNPSDIARAQKLLLEAAKRNSLASIGKYK